jgi:hypothetical protein
MKRPQYISTKDHIQVPASAVRENYDPFMGLSGTVYGYDDAGPYPYESEQCWDSTTNRCQPMWKRGVDCNLNYSGLCQQDASSGVDIPGVS